MNALKTSQDSIKTWVRHELIKALREKREFSDRFIDHPSRALYKSAHIQLARAMFCAKLDGIEFSKLPRI